MTHDTIEWQAVPLDRGLGEWRKDWDRVNHDLYGGHPLFDSRFIENLLKHFGTGAEYLLVCTENGTTRGMTILARRPLGIWQTLFPSQLPVAPILVPRADMLCGIFDALPKYAWQLEFLYQDPEYSPFNNLPNDRLSVLLTRHALTMKVFCQGSFDDYWRNRSKNLRKNIRRYRSRVNKAKLSKKMIEVVDASQMRLAIKRFGELESSGWKGRKGTAISIDNDQGTFYCRLFEDFAATGQAQVFEYYIDDVLAASRLMISGPKIKIILKTAYNEALRAYSPGRVLLFEILRLEIRDDSLHDSIEFYTNATPDQLQWSSDERWINHVCLFRNKFYLTMQRLAAFRHRIPWRK